ncbi:MAG: helix-turn-helix transcriptional regulator [Clostridia bacterium]|nr:helix-turn-helix transcriptional regulator [Clostridia bacterium]
MIIYQTENFGKRYEYRSNPHDNYVSPPHIHEFSEIAFTKSGITTVLLNGKKYLLPENHLIFILPNQIHEYSDETSSTMRCAVFSNDHIPVFFEKIKDRQLGDPVIDLTGHKELLRELAATDWGDTLRLCGLLNLICAEILATTDLVPRTMGEHSIFYEVIQYISQNFKEDIQLKDMAKRLGYHEKYLSSSLHLLTGMNFRTFLSSYRINFAKHLLNSGKTQKLRISDVALQCGFSSINSFNRAFREITGMTPSQYKTTGR